MSGPTGESPGFRSSSGSFVTDLIIGWNFGGQWLVHHYEPAHWFSLDGATTVTGLGGIAVTRYLAPEAPCWLLRFGLGSYERWVFHASELEKADAGLGIGVGFGRELSPHLSLECDLTWGTPKVEADGFTSEMETLGVSLAVKALAY